MSDINFEINAVLDDAKTRAGLEDFGSQDFIEGLGVLLKTYDQEKFSEKGRKKLYRRVVDLLQARLRIEAAFKKYPEIRDEKIERPMYLTGLPRTGTSALLNLLANDPDARPLKLWEGLMPDPCDNFTPGQEDPRYRMMVDWQNEQNKKNPDFSKIHHTTADTPEECIHLLNHTFQDVQFGMETMLEPYGSWFQQQDLHASYKYYFELLKMLQWQRPGKRWLLKSPGHLWALDIITEQFNDACIIITHRNPLEAVTSYASMMAALMLERDFNKKDLGPVVMEYLARKVEASLKQREKISDKNILDLQFNEFVDDSIATVNKIYSHFELPMSEDTKNKFQQYADAHPMGKHGKHAYNLDEYGLTEKNVLDRFDFYIKRFDVPMG